MKTPKKVPSKKGRKAAAKKVEPQPEPTMQEPEAAAPAAAATPKKADETISTADAASAATPKDRTPIKPADQEMHPALHHASTAKVLDEARWLGFQSLGAASAQPKATTGFGIGQATPTKSSIPAETPRRTGWLSSPGFEFSFKSPTGVLSPAAARILKDGEDKPGATPGRTLFKADEFTAPADLSLRKLAVPIGISSRYKEAHTAQFEKMPSIANHASAFRADPRFLALQAAVKRSPSKPELQKPDEATKTPNKLKRTQSKMDLTEGQMGPPQAKPAATPLKRTNSKIEHPRSALRKPPTQSTSRAMPSAGPSSAKRVKRTEADDAGSTRPTEDTTDSVNPQTPARNGLPRPTSRLLSPTKASLMRSHTVKATKSTSMIPSLLRSPSTPKLAAPSTISETMREGMREGIRKTSASVQKMKSILRTPNKKYSDDPAKIAAGTHMSPPPDMDFFGEPQPIPATAPVQKRVNFSASTLARVSQDELGKTPSPIKLRAGPDVGQGTVLYPRLQSADIEEPHVGSPVRRLTFGEATTDAPAPFSFTSDKTIKFGTSPSAASIRMVPPTHTHSNGTASTDAKKRKLPPVPTMEGTSDKENTTPPAEEENEGRSPKKARLMGTPVRKMPSTPGKVAESASKLPKRTPGRVGAGGASISKSRLAYLSTPKRTRG